MNSDSTTKNEPTPSLDYFGLNGKIALITGASSGLGLHFSRCLSNAGCTVVLAARRKPKLDALAEQINNETGKANKPRAFAVELDVSNRTSCSAVLSTVFSEIGTPDILINNAGIARPGRFLEADDADTDQVFSVNQSSVWKISQQVCAEMIKAGKAGSVINIASILGLDVMPGVSSYAVSKAAVVQMTKLMALELARHNIRVNAIAPGYFDTEINQGFLDSDAGKKIIKRVPFRRVGELHELDGLLYLLASQKSSFMTGAVIPIDGGHLVAGLA